MARLELARPKATDFESVVSAYSTTSAYFYFFGGGEAPINPCLPAVSTEHTPKGQPKSIIM